MFFANIIHSEGKNTIASPGCRSNPADRQLRVPVGKKITAEMPDAQANYSL
jgi:hypothetical protein